MRQQHMELASPSKIVAARKHILKYITHRGLLPDILRTPHLMSLPLRSPPFLLPILLLLLLPLPSFSSSPSPSDQLHPSCSRCPHLQSLSTCIDAGVALFSSRNLPAAAACFAACAPVDPSATCWKNLGITRCRVAQHSLLRFRVFAAFDVSFSPAWS